jgi:hypothetical protein
MWQYGVWKIKVKKLKVSQIPHLRAPNWYKTELPIFIRANAVKIINMQNEGKLRKHELSKCCTSVSKESKTSYLSLTYETPTSL